MRRVPGRASAALLCVLAGSECGTQGDAVQSSPQMTVDASDAGNAGGANEDGGSGAADAGPTARADGSQGSDGTTVSGGGPVLGGCPILPSNHIFNTPIDSLPAHPNSGAFLNTIGSHNLHLDLGTTVDPTSASYYGIPYNLVHGASTSTSWTGVSYASADSSLSWDPRPESDCASGGSRAVVSPCLASSVPQPAFPIPASPLVEGGVVTDPAQPYGDHHMLLLDVDACRLWELYHCYPIAGGGWDIFGSATFDLRSNALRPAGWTSADAAGFPILPLLLRADEASAGAIHHALRFTIQSSKIRTAYVWPARHLTSNGTASQSLPPMGQLFRLKASYAIPASFGTQARAILQALKTYGMYIADGGSDMYITGEPSAAWSDATFSQVQSVGSAQFEAVDLTPVTQRAGFDMNSAAVPP